MTNEGGNIAPTPTPSGHQTLSRLVVVELVLELATERGGEGDGFPSLRKTGPGVVALVLVLVGLLVLLVLVLVLVLVVPLPGPLHPAPLLLPLLPPPLLLLLSLPLVLGDGVPVVLAEVLDEMVPAGEAVAAPAIALGLGAVYVRLLVHRAHVPSEIRLAAARTRRRTILVSAVLVLTVKGLFSLVVPVAPVS